MEAAVRWSSHRQRFLVVNVPDPALTLNEVTSISNKSVTYHEVAHCNKLPNFGAFDWSKTDESIVALGLVSGSASLIKLSEDSTKPDVVATFRIKQQRKCNSIAFSTQDWLAVAVDKTRSDVCLFIYDASRGANNAAEPLRKLCAAELVSSVRFFPTQPQEIIASTQRSFVRLFDLRDGSPGGAASVQASTRNVNNIAIDPLDQNYFASAGSTDDPSVTVWDRRWMSPASSGASTGAVFEFKPAVMSSEKTTVWSMRYSGQRRGRLAICSSTGELKIIDMVEGSSSILRTSEYLPSNPYGGSPWSANQYVSASQSLEWPWYHDRRGRDRKTRIIAYDWIQDASSGYNQAILTLRSKREVGVLHTSTAKITASMSGRGDFSLALQSVSVSEAQPFSTFPPVPMANKGKKTMHSTNTAAANDSEEEDSFEDAREMPLQCKNDSPQLRRLLAASCIQRERCKQGYLLDCHKNMSIVAGTRSLEHLWEFIQRFLDLAADDGMVYNGLDLSFIGISGMWTEQIGIASRRRTLISPSKPEEAIVGLNTTREIPAFEGHRTNFPEHRQLCLALCGWKFTKDDLEQECQELINRGLHYQAIVQAVLHGETNIALNLLRDLIRSKTIQNIGLGALLASDSLNAQQKEMCLWMSADTDDPALKALLTFLNSGDWRDVMSTPYLHLGYRLALGLKYLNDTELSNYIQSQTQRVVMNGNLEGILLTGLGEQAMDLFQTYIIRTNDLQTAVLAMAFTNPLYVDDVRWDLWKETYFQQMQTWRTFVQRSLFTVQHNRMAKTREGTSLVKSPPAQIVLRCAHCRNALAHTNGTQESNRSQPSNALTSGVAVRVARPAANSGTVCPHCGRHMPRCGICKLWLGTPNPATNGGARELSRLDDIMAKFLTFCIGCGHGFHADHAKMWFAQHDVCPVPDCQCLCGSRK